jgi:hypothetical protein
VVVVVVVMTEHRVDYPCLCSLTTCLRTLPGPIMQYHFEQMVRCRSAGERFIPSMSCALTRLLKEACGSARSRTAVFVTLSPFAKDSRVTTHSLRFALSASQLRRVVCEPLEDEVHDSILSGFPSAALHVQQLTNGFVGLAEHRSASALRGDSLGLTVGCACGAACRADAGQTTKPSQRRRRCGAQRP